jgi:hypothetical protein
MLGDLAWAEKYAGREGLTIRSLITAIAQRRSVVLYAAIAAAGLTVAVLQVCAWRRLAEATGLTIISYPFVEYLLHRYVLHARVLWRTRSTAHIWRRLHYDHHMDPKDMAVLFAHPAATVPFLLLLSALAAAIGRDTALFPAMVCCSFLAFIFYEAMHAAAHMPLQTGNELLARRRRHHLRHHYWNEMANFGIATGVLDRLLPVSTAANAGHGPSPSVRNLGYDSAEIARYPWVAEGYARKRARLTGCGCGTGSTD